MISRFFIDRPIFANVIAILTVLFGLVTFGRLPVEQYPSIVPPTVQVQTSYPGANAQVLADTVAAPIEEQVNGVEGMLYMQSTSASDGSYSLVVTFEVGTNLDTAQVLVQNRVAAAEPLLPDEVQQQGVTVRKQSTNIILFASLTSPDKRFDSLYLSNYATLHIRDQLLRIDGVGDARVFGAGNYSMRIWLDPLRLRARALTSQDVIAAIREQNVQVAAGQLGQPPSPKGQDFQLTVNTLGRLSDVEQFESIIVKSEGTRVTRIRDVAKVELGAQTYNVFFQRSGSPAAGVAVFQLPGANALEVADRVRETMERLKQSFPDGVEYAIPFDTTLFVRQAIHEVYWTLFEAGVLVLLVILVFLQDWRAVLVPATTVPVTIVGAFAGMAAFGFTINLLTLFGLVLAIGIVVDDAIVVVENAAHHIEEGMTPRDATIKAMEEVTGPVIAITAVLLAVFLPTAFFGGITGQLYRQFALTIAATAVISAINALTLKPVQCAAWLRPAQGEGNRFSKFFNRGYDRAEAAYVGVVAWMVGRPGTMMAVFAGMLALTLFAYRALPTSFLPVEDQGYVIAGVQLPDAASIERTSKVVEKVNEVLGKVPGVEGWNAVGGNSIRDGATTSNAATFYVTLEDWAERDDHERSLDGILENIRHGLGQLQEAEGFAFPPPAIRGLGVGGGFEMRLQDRGGAGPAALEAMVQEILHDGSSQSGLKELNSSFRANVPQLFADVDRTKAKTLGVPLSSVFGTLQSFLGSAYVNDFNLFGRTYQVRVQAEPKFRQTPHDVGLLEVRNERGEMVPLGTLVDVRSAVGPQILTRYNLYPAAGINGEAAPGYSSGQALALMEQMAAAKLPPSMAIAWTGISYQEKQASGGEWLIFALAVLLVFLVLAAQYESWTNPLAVILVVPLALLGTVVIVAIRGMDNNVYTQIGVVLLIALSSKNAILIVEFARELRKRGRSVTEAAVEASRLRFRPILMTSFAFILGVYPLVVAHGAGASSRRALGTAVFGGMLTSTFLAVLFVPVFFVVCQGASERWAARRGRTAAAPAAPRVASHR